MEAVIQYVGTEPTKGRATDAAYDLRAKHAHVVHPGERKLIDTGTQILVPEGLAALVMSRSGMTLSKGLVVANAPGLIDPDYIGDVGVILHNIGDQTQYIDAGDRIAQLLFVKTADTQLVPTTHLGVTHRGDAGFGSSGIA